MITRLLGGLVLAVALFAGGYLRGCTDERRKDDADDAEREAAWQEKFDQQAANTAEREATLLADHQEADRATETDLKTALDANAGLARRLFAVQQATARAGGGALCGHPPADGARGRTAEIAGLLAQAERDLEQVGIDTVTDATALVQCQAKYDAAERATRGQGSAPPEPLVEPDLHDPADADRRREAVFDVFRDRRTTAP